MITAGVVAAMVVFIHPSPPASDDWFPYTLRLRLRAEQPGDVQLMWGRHAGYVTDPRTIAEFADATPDGFSTAAIPCPAGLFTGLILELPAQPIELTEASLLLPDGSEELALPLGQFNPLPESCSVEPIANGIRIIPQPGAWAALLEFKPYPALFLPVPQHVGLPENVQQTVQRQRWISAVIALCGLVLGGWTWRARTASKQSSRHEPQWLPAVAVVFAGLSLLWARRPDVFALPQFWAEDGAVFFYEQHVHGWRAWLMPYADYLHLWPRVIASVAAFGSAVVAPLVYLLGSVVVVIAVWLRVASPRSGLAAPMLCAVAIALVPHASELTLNLTNAQWFGALLLVLISIGRPPASRTGKILELITLLVFGLTGPFAALLLPLLVLRWWRDRDRHAGALLAVVLAAALVQAAAYFHQKAGAGEPPPALLPHLPELLAAVGLRTGGEFIGWSGARPDNAGHIVAGLILLGGWLALWASVPSRVLPRHTKLALGWTAFAMLLGAVLRYRGYPDELYQHTHAQRYFFAALLATIWLLLAGAARLTGWRRRICFAALALLAVQCVRHFRMPPLVDCNWYAQAPAIDRGEAVSILINPSPWAVVLPERDPDN